MCSVLIQMETFGKLGKGQDYQKEPNGKTLPVAKLEENIIWHGIYKSCRLHLTAST